MAFLNIMNGLILSLYTIIFPAILISPLSMPQTVIPATLNLLLMKSHSPRSRPARVDAFNDSKAVPDKAAPSKAIPEKASPKKSSNQNPQSRETPLPKMKNRELNKDYDKLWNIK